MNIFFKRIFYIIRRVKSAINLITHHNIKSLYHAITNRFQTLSFSQEGEDLVLARLFEGQSSGFFVDIGAYHPQRFSNTYYFYLKGWKGINIDAKPGSMRLFDKIRPRDINIEKAISNKKTELVYYEFNEPALNGFVENLSKERDSLNSYKITRTTRLQTYPLEEILDEYLPQGQNIDFLNIDVEGLDLEVLQSNNWNKYRPSVLLVEDLNFPSLDEMDNSEVVTFLKSKGYYLLGKTVNTLIFKNKNA